MAANEKATTKLWCNKCKDFYLVHGIKDSAGALHVEKADVDAHRATH